MSGHAQAVRKISPEPEANFRARNAITSKLVPELVDIVEEWRSSIDMEELEAIILQNSGALTTGFRPVVLADDGQSVANITAAMNMDDLTSSMSAAIARGHAAGMEAGIPITSEALGLELLAESEVTALVEMWADVLGPARLGVIQRTTERAIQDNVRALLASDLPLDQIVSGMGRGGGLTPVQANKLLNLEEQLFRELVPVPEILDPRTGELFQVATHEVRATIAQEVELERARMLRGRSSNIAQTEVQDGIQAGGEVRLEDGHSRGEINLAEAQKVWVTHPERSATGPCPICLPIDGMQIGFSDFFFSEFNGWTGNRPLAHPGCVCTVDVILEP